MQVLDSLTLSICIATLNRSKYIIETLDSITAQIVPGVEIVVLDGASSDETQPMMNRYCERNPQVRYIRQEKNSGVDADYDKAVDNAAGTYCWLMTDDDLIGPGGIEKIMTILSDLPDLVVVNAHVANKDFSRILRPRILQIASDRRYREKDAEAFFQETADYLSFIGGVIIRKNVWQSRDREHYYGSLFVHVGVIFQAPIRDVRVIAEPHIAIRYGNAMWTPRGFEIWMFKWPRLIWSFPQFSNEIKAKVCAREPYLQLKRLVWLRAIGSYSLMEYRRFAPVGKSLMALVVALIPGKWLNTLSSVRCTLFRRTELTPIYDLVLSPNASWLTRYLARRLDI